MSAADRRGRLWPTPDQLLLLRLCLGLEPDVARAYARWREQVDIDHVTSGTFRQLPMLGARLHAAGVEDDKSGIIVGTRRIAWVRSRFAMRTLAELDELLGTLDVPYILLKGVALFVDGTYPEPGLRPACDIDLLARPDSLRRVRAALLERGWTMPWIEASLGDEELLASRHAASFRRGEDERIDFHWGAMHAFGRAQRGYEFLWTHAVRHTCDGRTYRTLAPTEQLLHTAVHGARGARDEPLRWLMDAWMIIDRHGDRIDWSRLIACARRQRHTGPLLETLRYLSRELECDVPADALEALEATPRSTLERIESQLDRRPTGVVLKHVRRACRVWRMAEAEHATIGGRLREAPRYLKACLHVPGDKSVAAAVAHRLRRRRDLQRG